MEYVLSLNYDYLKMGLKYHDASYAAGTRKQQMGESQ